MHIKRVHSESPYERRYGFSRAVAVDGRVLVAGTAPIPSEGEQVAATAFDQMKRCTEIARRAMADLDVGEVTVVRTRMFITDPSDVDEIGRAHAEGFGEDAPTATMVVVASLLDPVWKIELEVEAVVNRR
jgi:enamine deaminase RidA (YjgF/YER057c/UK114 family)